MASNTNERASDLAVMDAQEYKQKRRLENILDAHDKVEEMGERAYGLYVDGQISNDGKNIRILRAAQEYIREVHNLLMEYDHSLDEDERNQYWLGDPNQPLGSIKFESHGPVVFCGLKDVLNAQDVYTEQWEEPKETRHGPNQTVTRSASYTVPERVSMRAYLLVNRFLSEEKSLEIQFEDLDDQLPAWGFEEVEEDDDDEELAVV